MSDGNGGISRLVESRVQASSSLIYSYVKGPVRTATLGEHTRGDVCPATGDALLTHAGKKAVGHTQAGYQGIASNSSKGGSAYGGNFIPLTLNHMRQIYQQF